MRVRHYFRTIKRHTIRNRINIIIGVVILILLFGLVNFWFGMRVMSGLRAYVGGEGLWSKAQKEAVIHLVKYTDSNNETDYQRFLANTEVQLGDRQARLEMDKSEPDMAIVRDGFIRGGNHPDDIDDLYFLYRRFGDVGYMNTAIEIWAEGDREIENLLVVGERIHQLVSAPLPADDNQAHAARADELSALLNEMYAIDARLTVLENEFSATLGEGSRWVSSTLMRITVATTILLGLLALAVAVMSARTILRLDRQKSAFVSLAAHQLRTPLTAMSWSAESLFAKPPASLSPVQKKYLDGLYKGARKMSDLVNDLLRVSSLELGTYQPQEIETDISEVIHTVLREQQDDVVKKDLTIAAEVPPNAPLVKLDKQGLQIILQNLVSNSVKYSRDGGRIEVNATIRRRRLHISLSDNGIGIPQDQQSQVFTRLFRASNVSEHGPSEGTGLGLYIVKIVVQQMDGAIWFDSARGSGTHFYVTLPVQRKRKRHKERGDR